MKKSHVRPMTVLKLMMIVYFIAISLAVLRQLVLKHVEADPFNYFCLPFVTFQPSKTVSVIVHVCVTLLQVSLCLVIIICYTFLFIYTHRQTQNQQLRHIKSRQTRLKAFARKTVFHILNNLLTWLPILTIQLVEFCGVSISAMLLLWIALACVSFYLTFSPLFIIINAIQEIYASSRGKTG